MGRCASWRPIAVSRGRSALRSRASPAALRRRLPERLRDGYGPWPLSDAPLGTAVVRGRARVVLRERDGCYLLTPRGWQLMTAPPPVEEVRLRLSRG